MPVARKPAPALRPIPRIHALTGRTLAELRPARGETIRRFHARTTREGQLAGLPTIVAERVNGELRPVLKAAWHRRIGPRLDLVLISAPMGGGAAGNAGGSKGVASILGLVALVALAPLAAGAIAGAVGLGAAGTSVISALIIGGGSYLLSHFLGAKRGAKTQALEYSVDIKSNQARSQEPIPVGYGQVKFFPDLGAPTFSDYSGTDQIFHALYVLGCGFYDCHEFGIGDTAIWTYAGGVREGYASNVQLQFVDPGTDCTLFPTDVYASSEVSGQTLPDPYGTKYTDGSQSIGPDGQTSGASLLGPYVANPAGTITNKLAIDLIWPNGLYYTQTNGNTKQAATYINWDYQQIDDQGHTIGDWTIAFADNIWRETKLPLRLTLFKDVPPGRYQVRISRAVAMSQTGGVDTCQFAALKSYLQGPNAVPYASRVAIQMTADKLLSATSSSQIYVIATRRIPVWNGSTLALAPSQNPVWAALDVWNNADYGGNLPLDKVDLPTLVQLAADADTRGDTFNYRFTAQTTIQDAIETCLRPMLTKPIFLWDQFSMVRDQQRSLPKLALTDYEISRGTLELTYTLKDTQTSDGVILEYTDETTWEPAEVNSRAAGVTLLQPTRVQMPGVTNRRQATVAARYLAAVNNYRRKSVTFEIEADGRLLRRADLVSVQSELPLTWGQASRVLAYSSTDGSLNVETDLDWSGSSTLWYVEIRQKDGTPFGPVLCSRGADDSTIILNTQDLARVQSQQGLAWTDVIARGTLQEPASIAFSAAQPSSFMGLVTAITQGSAENTFKIELVNDAPEVYTIDGSAVEPLPTPSSLVLPTVPGDLQKINAYLAQEGTSIALRASWQPDPAAVTYQGQLSYDGGASYAYSVYDGGFPFFTVSGLSPNDCLLRLRGRSGAGLVGDWVSVSLSSPDLILSAAALGYGHGFDDLLPALYASVQMQPLADLEDLTSITIGTLVGAARDVYTLRQDTARAHAKIEEVNLAFANSTMAIADRTLTISASVDQNTASIVQETQARVTAEEAIATTITTLTATVSSNTAAITQEAQTRATADSATATTITTLTATVGSNTAAITQEAQTRATADSAISTTITTLQSTVSSNTAAISQEAQTRASADSATATQLSSLTSTVGSNTAAITQESQTRATNDSALSSQISTLSSTVGSNTSSISTLQSSQDGIQVQYGVIGNIDGTTGGFIFTGVGRLDGSVSYTLAIKADVLVDGTLTASKIVDLSIGTGKIANNAITSFVAVNGAVTLPSEGTADNNLSIGITLDQPAQVYIAFNVLCYSQGSTGATDIFANISVDGSTTINTEVFQVAGGTFKAATTCIAIVSLGAGSHTIVGSVNGTSTTDHGGAISGTLIAQAFKK